METKGKKRLLNIIMVLLILVIAASGVLTVGKIQGWFDKPEDICVTSGQTKGVVNIQRNGIGYTLNADSRLQTGDLIETKKGAQAELIWKDQEKLILNEKSEVTLTACDADKNELQVSAGEVFGDMQQQKGTFDVAFAGNTAQLSGAVFSVSVQSGSSSLNLYAGDISILLADGTQERVEAGEYLSVTNSSDGTSSCQIQKMQPASLNEFLISQAQSCASSKDLCFTPEELQKVLDDREAEKQTALENALNAEKIPADNKKDMKSDKNEQESEAQSEAETDGSEADGQNSMEEYTPEEAGDSSSGESSNICTITIRCDTILDNLDNLDAGKEAYVPSNGVILATSSVEFEDGETVFDVLNRVCEYAGIQLEYSWTPLYSSYYVEGINNLYEFDCGNESGWMYKVNGWFPNYGCSSYTLENGDDIVWCYTCNGLGADVGGPTY